MKKDLVAGYIDKDQYWIVEFLKKLVTIPTVNPPGMNYEKIVSLIESECRAAGLKTKKITTPASRLRLFKIRSGSKRLNLLAHYDAGRDKTVHINCHYDVVPAAGAWKQDPFKPILRGGRLFGRGSLDMKANIACILGAMRAIRRNDLELSYNVQLSFTPDEETGGKTGFGYLIDKKYIKADFVIGEGYDNNFISYGNKGMLWLKLDVLGRSCHACEPYKGINSFEKMVLVASELIKLKHKIEQRKTRFGTKKSKDRHPTMVLGGEISGGRKINIVPDLSTFTIDRRLIPEENIAQAKREIMSVIRRLQKRDKGLKVRIETLAKEMPVISPWHKEFFHKFSSCVEKITGKKARFALLAGGTDPRFAIRKGTPSIGYSPDGGDSCHCDNEYVKVKSLIDTSKIFVLFLTG